MTKSKRPITWTIAGSDSGGGAGIQADLHTMNALGTYGCSVITVLTAQNSYQVTNIGYSSSEMITAQIQALESDLPAAAVKIGMLGNTAVMQSLLPFLHRYTGHVILDPVMVSTTGAELLEPSAKRYLIEHIFPHATLVTPNLAEASNLLERPIRTASEMEQAAQDLLALGCRSVLLKGGHTEGPYAQDYWTDGKEGVWLSIERRPHPHRHGSGCSLSSAICSALAQGYSIGEALIIAKSYISQGIRLAEPYGSGPGPIMHKPWENQAIDFPWITDTAEAGINRPQFPSMERNELGFYPVVPDSQWLERLLKLGVRTLQLRNKNLQGAALEKEIKTSVELAKRHNARLFINDYWELAIQAGAYGVHLGQEDIKHVDFSALERAGLRLGISTHNYQEAARAHALRPSYIALGPIYPTTSKVMTCAPQGVEKLHLWRQMLPYPLVAIGGINLERLDNVINTGVHGVAMISALLQAKNLDETVARWIERIERIERNSDRIEA